MSEKKCECKCKSKSSSKELPVLIGGIVVYELAIIIGLLVLIFLDCDAPCEKPQTSTFESEETFPTEE
ncbi:hypothetical protein [Desulfosporosinus sp. OT]|uniref:hypothetical protein n=1 Tax=Desulfosporosinus sp. OT TaxID=913865 RepID=UPI000223B182|nr:hypothetical protein [Desulfosporosinus sp. OT]EGW41613.1 hypothetical protein DOT_0381 [Desulfosporosinus sp. OT]